MNPKCIICEMKKTELKHTDRCKLCGMGSFNMKKYNNYSFCCGFCVNKFKDIVQKTLPHDMEQITKREVII